MIAQRDLSRLFVSGVTYTVFGVLQAVAVIWHWPQLSRHDVSLWLYLTMLAAVVLTGAYGWWAARRPAPQQDSPSGVAPAATSGT